MQDSWRFTQADYRSSDKRAHSIEEASNQERYTRKKRECFGTEQEERLGSGRLPEFRVANLFVYPFWGKQAASGPSCHGQD